MRQYGIWHILALIALFLGVLFLITGFPPEPVRQVTSGDASTLELSGKESQLLASIIIVVLSIGALGVGLGFLLIFLNREVATAKATQGEETNPLDYRIYGHAPAILWSIIIGVGMLLLLMTTDLLPEQAGAEAEKVDTLFQIEFIIISVIFGLVMGLMIHSLLFFRAAPDDMSDGKFIHGNIKLEILWTAAPLVLVLILGVYTAVQLDDISEEKEGEIGIRVIGQQWNWRFIYPSEVFFTEEEFAELDADQQSIILSDGGVSTSELVLVQDQTVRLEMLATDVIHSFWIPEFRIKRDVVPGVETILRYTPILPGEYRVRCAELCGLQHWAMYADVRVVDEADYSEWIDRSKERFGDPIAAGESLYQQLCQTCHSIDGSDGTGPTWQNVIGSERQLESGGPVIANYDYIQESIWNPNAKISEGYAANIMPQNFSETLPQDAQIRQIFAYMCTLSEFSDNAPTCAEFLTPAAESE